MPPAGRPPLDENHAPNLAAEYEAALDGVGLTDLAERDVLVRYEGVEVGRHRLDLVIEDSVVVELKAVSELAAAHYEQVRSYLKASGLEVGLRERSDIRRIEHPAC